MSDDTLTLVLNGDIPLDLFTRAVEQVSGLVTALSSKVAAADEPLEWQVSYLASGSMQTKHAQGAKPPKLAARLVKARVILATHVG